MSTTVVFICKDIFFWPVVREAVTSLGHQLVIASRADDAKLDGLHSGQAGLCLIDLSSVNAAQIGSTVETLKRRLGDGLRLVAFGPHVQEARLQAAADAGCAPVLSRGQFNARLTEYLADWLPSDCS
jgi:hypothetical protein